MGPPGSARSSGRSARPEGSDTARSFEARTRISIDPQVKVELHLTWETSSKVRAAPKKADAMAIKFATISYITSGPGANHEDEGDSAIGEVAFRRGRDGDHEKTKSWW
jgi:hypothetical protein